MVDAVVDAGVGAGMKAVVVLELQRDGEALEQVQDPELGLHLGERGNSSCFEISLVERGKGWLEVRTEAWPHETDESDGLVLWLPDVADGSIARSRIGVVEEGELLVVASGEDHDVRLADDFLHDLGLRTPVLDERDHAVLIDALWPRRQVDLSTMSVDDGDLGDAGADLIEEGIGTVLSADVWHGIGGLVEENWKKVSKRRKRIGAALLLDAW